MNEIDAGSACAPTGTRLLSLVLIAIAFALSLSLASKAVQAAEEEEEDESPALGSIDYIVYPAAIEAGERAIEIRGARQIDDDDELDGSGVMKLAVETTMTDFWLIAPYLEFEKEGDEDLKLEAVEIENRFQLTPQGKYWLDVGFLVEAEFHVDGEDKKKLRYGPLLEKQFGRMVATTNFIFQNQFGSDAKDHDEDTLFTYMANVRYLLSPVIEPGVSAYGGIGALGEVEDSSDQVHQVGPSIQGKFPLGTATALKYRTEAVFGVTHGSPDATWVGHLEYEF